MSCLTCSNCGFANSLSPDSEIQTLKSSDNLISQILRGSRPLLESDHGPINDDIAKLEQLQSWYNVQLRGVLESLRNRKSVYAPVFRLPRDVLLEIFHSVCDSWRLNEVVVGSKDFSKHDSLDMTGPLWVLGQVCGHWRNILHTSPASWAQYVLVRTPFSKHAPEILRTYLERTGDHPLSVVALLHHKKPKDNVVMSSLVQSSHRWRHLCIQARAYHMHHFESVSHFPLLQTFEVHMWDNDGSVSDICLKAPQLWQATLHIQGFEKFRLPSGITHYSGNVTCVQQLRLLSQLPQLKACRINVHDTSLTSAAPVVMAELCHLYIRESHTLNLLTAPMLQSLTIAEIPEKSSPLSNVSRFLDRSGCRLKSFSMPADTPSASISAIFPSESCSMISCLKLEIEIERDSNDGLIKILAASLGLPNLRHLLLSFGYDYYVPKSGWLALLDTIRSRCKAGQLKVIETSFEDASIHRGIEADIRAAIGDNVQVRVGNWNPLYLDYRYTFSGPGLPQY